VVESSSSKERKQHHDVVLGICYPVPSDSEYPFWVLSVPAGTSSLGYVDNDSVRIEKNTEPKKRRSTSHNIDPPKQKSMATSATARSNTKNERTVQGDQSSAYSIEKDTRFFDSYIIQHTKCQNFVQFPTTT
jgi:hypothetical protein